MNGSATGYFDVTAFGALGDGATLATGAIQRAIDAAAAVGGRVVVPAGRFRIGTIFIKSGVTLELTAHAVLLGSGDWADYPGVNYEAWGTETRAPDSWPRHLVVIQDAQNVTLCGRGTIDGGGEAFWDRPEDPHAWIRPKPQRPGAMLCAIHSQDVLIEGVRLTNPPNWHSDLFACDRVQVRGVSIITDPRTPNNDGIDISGSRDVVISDCFIDTGDDGIVINARPRETKRVTVTNCTIRSHCAALKVGWEFTRHNISQIAFSNCVLFGCNRGVAFYTANGAVIEDVTVSNIAYDSNCEMVLCRPIHMDLRKGRDTGTFGAIRNVTISNFVGRTQGRIPLTAEDGGRLEDITLRDVQLAYPYIEDPAEIAPGAKSSQFSNPCPEARGARAAVVAQNIDGLLIENLRTRWPEGAVPTEWKWEVKRENGGVRLFRPDYATTRPTAFSAVWARGCNGVVRAPFATASEAGVETVAQVNSTMDVRR